MEKNIVMTAFVAVLLGTATTSCSSNDDGVQAGIEIPGITITGDTDCCSAEEALQVYRFLQGVRIIHELSTVIDGKYNVFAYSKTGTLHRGYNDLYFVATKRLTGNYVKNFEIESLTPLMHMVQTDMWHSTPVSAAVTTFDDGILAVKHVWVSLLMNTSDDGEWVFSYEAQVLDSKGGVNHVAINVEALPDGQEWLKSFKVADDTYFLSLVNPTEWQAGTNTIKAYISKKSNPITTPYALAEESFIVEIDPRMPDMGGHTSPGNTPLTQQQDGSYQGTINLTMTGLWRIHLTVKDAQGSVVAGGDDLTDGHSSLYWDVTI